MVSADNRFHSRNRQTAMLQLSHRRGSMESMKIVIAPDSFKGSLTARQAADAIERGVRRATPDVDIISVSYTHLTLPTIA